MSWAKFDDRYDDNRKIKRAWRRHPAAVALHAMAITYCSRHDTDGIVDLDWLIDKLPSDDERQFAIATLVEGRLFDEVGDEHWYVHDFLQYNPSGEETAARSARAAEAGRLGGLAKARAAAKASASKGSSTSPSKVPAPVVAPARDPSSTTSSPVPSRPVPTTSSSEPDVTSVFDEWIQATGKTGATVLTDKRRRLIRNALRLYSQADVTDAVRGWHNSPHHRGENQSGTIYNDLELLLRDAEHIEKFRDLQRGGSARKEPRLADIHAAQARRNAA